VTPTVAKVASSPRPALWVAIAVVGTVLGLGGGYAVGKNRSQPVDITTQVPVKVTLHGRTITRVSNVTLPAVTSTTTTTSVSTVTSTVTSVG
jgi:hypothetical protein